MTAVSTDRRFGVNSGAAFKVPVRAATTANITLSGLQTVDGVSVIAGDRVLVQNQTSAVDNGVYDVDTGTWTRSADFDGSYDVVYGTLIPINEGTTYGFRIRRVTNTGTVTPGTTAFSFGDALYSNASGIEFDQSGTGAIAQDLQTKNRQVKSVFDFMTAPQISDVLAGTKLVDVSAAIQAAEDACALLGCSLDWPAGVYYTGTTTIQKKKKVNWLGAGRDSAVALGTVISYAGTSDAVQFNGTKNASTSANYTVRDLVIQCTTLTAGKGCFADLGGSYVHFINVGFTGNDRLLIFDQTEISTVEKCDFELGSISTCGLWLVNGADRTAGANTLFTNRITVKENQFDGTAGIGVVDDGGAAHHYSGNNFNEMARHLQIHSVLGLTIDGENELESPTSISILFQNTTLAGNTVGPTTVAKIEGNFFYSADAIPFLEFAVSALDNLELNSNHFNNANAGGSIVSGASSVASWFGRNNIQVGTGQDVIVGAVNTYNIASSFTPTWSADSGAPAIGNGTITGVYERNGNLVTVHIKVAMGTTTTFGTGAWYFVPPASFVLRTGSVAVDAHGAGYVTHSSTFTDAVSVLRVSETGKMRLLATGGTTFFSSSVPVTWASGDELDFTLTFPIGQKNNG